MSALHSALVYLNSDHLAETERNDLTARQRLVDDAVNQVEGNVEGVVIGVRLPTACAFHVSVPTSAAMTLANFLSKQKLGAVRYDNASAFVAARKESKQP